MVKVTVQRLTGRKYWYAFFRVNGHQMCRSTEVLYSPDNQSDCEENKAKALAIGQRLANEAASIAPRAGMSIAGWITAYARRNGGAAKNACLAFLKSIAPKDSDPV